jgi:hypothetical protein
MQHVSELSRRNASLSSACGRDIRTPEYMGRAITSSHPWHVVKQLYACVHACMNACIYRGNQQHLARAEHPGSFAHTSMSQTDVCFLDRTSDMLAELNVHACGCNDTFVSTNMQAHMYDTMLCKCCHARNPEILCETRMTRARADT